MQKSIVYYLFTILLLAVVLSGCGGSGGGGGNNTPVARLNEDFQSYTTTNDWTSPDWDNKYGTTHWAITNDINDGSNLILQHTSGTGGLVYKKYNSSNYSISTKFKPGTDSFSGGVIARVSGGETDTNMYMLILQSSPPNYKVVLLKASKGGFTSNVSNDFGSAFQKTIFYTLTLKVSGKRIDGTVTDGTNTVTVNYNDPSPLGPGMAGFYENVGTGACFDNIKLTEP